MRWAWIMSDRTPDLPAAGAEGAAIRMVVFDFDGVFTDNTVFSDDGGSEWVRCWRGDGLGLQKLRDVAIPAWVLSTETHPVVSRRCAKLGIACRQGLNDKAVAFRELAAAADIPLESVAYVGNDINDAGCLRLAGTAIVVSDAHPDVLAAARYRTRLPGGFGAVREICDWIHASVSRARAAKPT
jgi:3-deoxy-D-manno-octulosonate 8-phosphate phosphatase (KDO 8-P phosphatase)